MLLHELINERWEKGHLTTKQLMQTVKHFVGSRGTVSELPKEHQRSTGEVVRIEMLYHEFLSIFGSKRAANEIMSRVFDVEKELKKMTDPGAKHLYTQYDIKQTRDRLYKLNDLLARLHKTSINKIRNLVPYGWILTGNFEGFNIDSLHSDKIIFTIKRDFTTKAERRDFYYHITKLSALPNIKQKGLVPASNKRLSYDGYRNRIFLSTSYPSYDFVHQLITGSLINFSEDHNIAILKVSLPQSIETYTDDQADGAVFVEQPIPPQNISVVYTGPLSKMPNV